MRYKKTTVEDFKHQVGEYINVRFRDRHGSYIERCVITRIDTSIQFKKNVVHNLMVLVGADAESRAISLFQIEDTPQLNLF